MSTKKCETCGASRDNDLGPWAGCLCPECAEYRQQSDIENRTLTRWGVIGRIISDDRPSVPEPPRRIPNDGEMTIEFAAVLMEDIETGERFWMHEPMTMEVAKRFVERVIDAGQYTATIVPIPVGLPDPSEFGNTLNNIKAESINAQLTETVDDPFAELSSEFTAANPGAIA